MESIEQKTKDMIKRHEGFRPHVYLDTVGIPTGGYGHAFQKGSHLSQEVCNLLFEDDYQQARADMERLINQYAFELNLVREAVLVDMLFNLGLTRLKGFKKMLTALQKGDWEAAANEMVNSTWYTQTKTRAVELVEMMRTGKWVL